MDTSPSDDVTGRRARAGSSIGSSSSSTFSNKNGAPNWIASSKCFMKSDSDSDLILSWSLPYLRVTRVEARSRIDRTPRSAHVLDPLHGLLLGVDAQREPRGGRREDAILHAMFVGRQAFRGPILYYSI